MHRGGFRGGQPSYFAPPAAYRNVPGSPYVNLSWGPGYGYSSPDLIYGGSILGLGEAPPLSALGIALIAGLLGAGLIWIGTRS